MVRHIILFTLAGGCHPRAEAARPDRASGAAAPDDRAARVSGGADVGLTAGNFDFAVVADFDDLSSYLAYRDHPAHRAVTEESIMPIHRGRACVQYEI